MQQARASLVAAALVVCAAAAFGAEPSRAGMVLLPAGSYTPFLRLKAPNASAPAPLNVVTIGAFSLDVEPVTNAEFLDFVTAHPEWRRSRIKPLFAEDRYLRRWSGDLALADAEARNEPVTNVSWFAAEAYCRARARACRRPRNGNTLSPTAGAIETGCGSARSNGLPSPTPPDRRRSGAAPPTATASGT